MKQVKTVLLIILFLSIMGLLGYNTKVVEDTTKEIKGYQDSLNYIISLNEAIEIENDSLMEINDSLSALPAKIKTIYREKYIIINHSDIDQLDSILRAEF